MTKTQSLRKFLGSKPAPSTMPEGWYPRADLPAHLLAHWDGKQWTNEAPHLNNLLRTERTFR